MVDEQDVEERVLSIATERFERRLAEEMAVMRVETGREFASVRQDMREGFGDLREEMADTRVELLKWSFLFWIGQVVTIAGLLAFMLRASGR